MTSRQSTLFKFLFITLFVSVVIGSDLPAATVNEGAYGLLKKQGESYFKKESFAKAHEVYLKAQKLDLSPPDQRWVDFRVADTLWRFQASTNNPDRSQMEQARSKLQKMIRDLTRPEQQDRIWVEVQESLADSWWFPRNNRNWSAGWAHYQKALDWWGGAADINLAAADLSETWQLSTALVFIQLAIKRLKRTLEL